MRKFIPRTLAILTAFLMTLSVVACQDRNSNSNTENNTLADGSVDTDNPEHKNNPIDGSMNTDSPVNDSVSVDNMDFVTLKNKDTQTNYNESECSVITLNGNSAKCSDSNVTIKGGRVTITAEGNYIVRGTLNDGQIIINAPKTEDVRLILDNVNIHCSDNAPIYVISADKTIITLATSSVNSISDGASYNYTDADKEEPNAAIFSKDDLSINGSGTLIVDANYNNGIGCKDDLKIVGAAITVTAVNNAIKGKDSVTVAGGNITAICGSNGIQASNDTDEGKGYIHITDGTFDITSEGDGIQAVGVILIEDGNFSILSGDGHGNGQVHSNAMGRWDFSFNEDGSDNGTSIKGIKSNSDICINGGTYNLDCADDTIHSNSNIYVNGGLLTLASGDDGIHADSTITVNKGSINITTSYEGIEAATITINDGDIEVTASDDGLNATNGSGGMMGGGGFGGGFDGDDIHGGGGMGGFGGGMHDGGGMGGFGDGFGIFGDNGMNGDSDVNHGNGVDHNSSIDMIAALSSDSANAAEVSIVINGGTLYVNASGDGIDSNNTITMNGGVVVVDGPTSNGDGALDYERAFYMNGGYLIATGSSGMACNISSDSTQCGAIVTVGGASAGETISVADSSGNVIMSYTPSKNWNALNISSPDIKTGETYYVYAGGSLSGATQNGHCFLGGTVTDSRQLASYEQTSIVYGNTGGFGGGGMGSGGGKGNGNKNKYNPQ